MKFLGRQMKTMLLILTLLFSTSSYAEDFLKDYNVYFFGLVKHFEPTDKTNEGNMQYFAVSKSFTSEKWTYEGGVGTYKDSYNMRSYILFANILNDDYRYGIFQPLIGLQVSYKGVDYVSDDMKVIAFPTLKLRVGAKDGFFADIMAIPKIGTITNGVVSVEFGYSF